MSANEEAKKDATSADRDVPAKKGCRPSCLEMCVIVMIVVLGLGLLIPSGSRISPLARMMQASSNCRQILITLKSYAGDHNGLYPEGRTANEAFRELFKAGLLEDERAFTAATSPFEPDNNIGDEPNFDEALKAGENHWAMTGGVKDSDNGNMPLVFENPVRAEWPPRWNANAAGQKKEGRAWKSGRIVIGRNDGSVAGEALNSAKGDAVPLKPGADGRDLFEVVGPHVVLDVER